MSLRSLNSFRIILISFISAGLINLSYNLWVLSFGDFVGWNNPYGNILGTFGNPNFIGAFLGMLFSVWLAFALDSQQKPWKRIGVFCCMPITAFEILASDAVQGRVVASFGSGIVLFFYLKSKFSRIVLVAFTLLSGLIGSFAVAGAFQKGPLTALIYKNSVSLRGQYWLAAWNTGKKNILTGSGMDSFGDMYRSMRDAHALELPGINTVVNTAHNVPLDMFAFGGLPLISIYLLIIFFSGRSAFRILSASKKFDFVSVALVSAWSGYQLQSIISINQIGLATWGWLLSGLLISYELSIRDTKESQESGAQEKAMRRKSINKLPEHIRIIAFFSSFLGFLIALPPLSSDISWKNARDASSLPLIEKSMDGSYFNPQNAQKYVENIDVLERSELYDLSRTYALQAVKWNPESFDLWKLLYLVRNSTEKEKLLAISNMKRLDPLNPDVTSIK